MMYGTYNVKKGEFVFSTSRSCLNWSYFADWIKIRHEISSLAPRCDTAYVASCLPTFRNSLSVTYWLQISCVFLTKCLNFTLEIRDPTLRLTKKWEPHLSHIFPTFPQVLLWHSWVPNCTTVPSFLIRRLHIQIRFWQTFFPTKISYGYLIFSSVCYMVYSYIYFYVTARMTWMKRTKCERPYYVILSFVLVLPFCWTESFSPALC